MKVIYIIYSINRIMLYQSENATLDKYKEWGFSSYLQWAWIEYPDLQWKIGQGMNPEQKRLKNVNERMNSQRIGFDLCYLHSLPQAEVNPLKTEQEAWELLSPIIRQHVDNFGSYIESYSPQNIDQEQLLSHVNCGWDLLQQWNIISKSYKAKYENEWDIVEEREQSTKDLIQELISMP